jgi:hypothetical protein
MYWSARSTSGLYFPNSCTCTRHSTGCELDRVPICTYDPGCQQLNSFINPDDAHAPLATYSTGTHEGHAQPARADLLLKGIPKLSSGLLTCFCCFFRLGLDDPGCGPGFLVSEAPVSGSPSPIPAVRVPASSMESLWPTTVSALMVPTRP